MTARAVTVIAVAVGATVLGGLAAARAAGLRVNATASMPVGLWRMADADGAVRPGVIVVACPPDNTVARDGAARGYIGAGRCPGGVEPLIKRVAAVGGDLVSVSDAGVSVAGRLLPGTIPLSRDSAGRALRRFAPQEYRLRSGEIWLVSSHDRRSFDSRYFGPVPAANVLGIATPIWVFR